MSDTKKKIVVGDQPIYDASSLGAPKIAILGFQHVFAMFGATVLVPLLTGLDVSSTLLFAGLGTLLFHFLTKRKVPAFLGSSFAFLGGYAAIAPLNADGSASPLLPYACFGVACAGLVYLVLAGLFRVFGANKVMKFFPPVVTGPIIIAIGLNLSQSAISNCETNWLIALVAIVVVIVCNIWGKGMVKIIPILLGVIASYFVAAVTGNIDFTPVREAAWIGFPIHYENTVFSIFTSGKLDGGLLFASVVTMTKVFDPAIIRLAAVIAAVLSFCPKFAAIIEVMPSATIGGISLVLYGMISAVGVRNLVETHVDFSKSRNVLIAALILVLSIGINYSAAGAITFGAVSFSGLATGSLVGILLNAILPGKDYNFEEEGPNATGVDLQIHQGENFADEAEKNRKA